MHAKPPLLPDNRKSTDVSGSGKNLKVQGSSSRHAQTTGRDLQARPPSGLSQASGFDQSRTSLSTRPLSGEAGGRPLSPRLLARLARPAAAACRPKSPFEFPAALASTCPPPFSAKCAVHPAPDCRSGEISAPFLRARGTLSRVILPNCPSWKASRRNRQQIRRASGAGFPSAPLSRSTASSSASVSSSSASRSSSHSLAVLPSTPWLFSIAPPSQLAKECELRVAPSSCDDSHAAIALERRACWCWCCCRGPLAASRELMASFFRPDRATATVQQP